MATTCERALSLVQGAFAASHTRENTSPAAPRIPAPLAHPAPPSSPQDRLVVRHITAASRGRAHPSDPRAAGRSPIARSMAPMAALVRALGAVCAALVLSASTTS